MYYHSSHVDGKDVDAKKAIPRDAAPVPVSDGPQCKKVFLGGLSLDTEEDDIKAVLEQLGTVSPDYGAEFCWRRE